MPPRRGRNREAMRRVERREPPEVSEAEVVPQASQIVPTRLELTVIYIPGASHTRLITGSRIFASFLSCTERHVLLHACPPKGGL
jgi:hypothetical protein